MAHELGGDQEVALSLVVPVWNAESHLQKLVSQIKQLDDLAVSWQLVFVDDGSSDNCVEIMSRLATENPQIMSLANPKNQGAGVARNYGWRHVKGRYTIFFDADDNLHTGVIPTAIKQMDALPDVDTAMFAYRYEREETRQFTAMGKHDIQIFNSVLKGNDITIGTLDQMSKLLHFTNYPWNKILRTERFRQTGLQFGSTTVHNDILGHWYSLIFARKIMIIDKVICTHIVHPKGSNLTNRTGRDRLQMFDAMSELYDMLESHPIILRQYAHFFWRLTQDVVIWGRSRIAKEYKKEVDHRYANLISRIDLADLARMRTIHAPELARSLTSQLLS